jgi:hypothetical protein
MSSRNSIRNTWSSLPVVRILIAHAELIPTKERNAKHLQRPQTHIAARSTKALRQLRTVMKSTSMEMKNRTN